MNRACSVVFYMAIASITCVMSKKVCRVTVENKTDVCLRTQALNKLYLWGIFTILFAVSALRFGIGNDYPQYTLTAHEAYVGGYVVTEQGFNYLVRFVYTLLNGEYYEAVFAVFGFVTLLVFLHVLYRDSVDFAQSFFLFMTLGIYFQTFNTVRYYFALAVAFCCMRYVLEKDYIRFVFWILIAALFHKSVLLVIPVYFLATFTWKRWMFVLGMIAGVACFAARGILLELALMLYPSYRNTIYLDGGMSVTSVLRIATVLLLYLWFLHYMGKDFCKDADYQKIRFYGQLNFVAFLAATFFSFLPVVTRIVYYFSISWLLMIPLMVEKIEDNTVKTRVRFLIIAVCVVHFMFFLLHAHEAGVGLLPYRSWLFEERYVEVPL
ncbi:MAG: EpsG family protein [Lachnospiraceae bacterium]|nr:EpsG family protein [Lachnospiraceae bacterium]